MLHLTDFKFDDKGHKTVVLLDIPENYEPEDTARELHTQFRSKLLPADLILLRPPVWVPMDEETSQLFANKISERFPETSIKILTSNNYNHIIIDAHDGWASQQFKFEDHQLFLDKLRNVELKQLVKRTGSLYLSDGSYDFRLPSHELSNSFLRVGNIQTTRGALDSLFFWLLPYLNDIDGILIDTWSISSIALNASRLLNIYKSKNETHLRVEMFDYYIDDHMIRRHEFEEIVRRVSGGFQKPFLIFFSASMTGKSLQHFASFLSTMDCPTRLQKYLVFFRLGNSPIEINNTVIPELCDFSDELKVTTELSDQAIKTEIKIDPTTYFPLFKNDVEVCLKKDIAEKHKVFFDSYKDTKTIRIHQDSLVGGQKFRHHGIYIDVLEMLKIEHFSSKFQKIVDKLDPTPEMILVPPHDAGIRLADIASEQLATRIGQSPEIVEHLDLIIEDNGKNDDEVTDKLKKVRRKLKQLDGHDAILVLDDVLTTGNRLRGYQKRLRQLEYKGQIHYLVGVSRTHSMKLLEGISQTLKYNSFGPNHTLDFVETIILPDWDEESCPLCIENRLLYQLIKRGHVSDTLLERARLLRNSINQGLVDNVFIKLPSNKELQITPNSLFVKEGATQAVVMASVAAAVQELRNHQDSSKRLDAGAFPVRKVYSIGDLDTYTDGILQASLLRCITAKEFQRTSPDNNEQFINWARKIIDDKDDDGMREVAPFI